MFTRIYNQSGYAGAVVATVADRHTYSRGAVDVGIALAAYAVHARTVVVRPRARRRVQGDGLVAAVRTGEFAHPVRTDLRIARGNSRIRRAVVAQGRRGGPPRALVANRGAQRERLPRRQRVLVYRGRRDD